MSVRRFGFAWFRLFTSVCIFPILILLFFVLIPKLLIFRLMLPVFSVFPLGGDEQGLCLHRLFRLHRRTSLLLGGGSVRFSVFDLNETNEIGCFFTAWTYLVARAE